MPAVRAKEPMQERPQSPAGDEVSLRHGRTLGLRLLRERVLAKTREQLGLAEHSHGMTFAEVTHGEPVGAFLGRLLSAQNQLAAPRAAQWAGARLRQALADALQDGAAETLELLAAEEVPDEAAVTVVVEVLAEFGRRLDALVNELRPAGPKPAQH
ncbi:MAG: hypothetical protein H6838_08945 [Planctomycetes bacterium]|nr:hypothetical protein [Planctomycetota bacterium]MCB9885607.1 hypothetical protein [Planctomycetota bacterium]